MNGFLLGLGLAVVCSLFVPVLARFGNCEKNAEGVRDVASAGGGLPVTLA